MFLGVLLCIPYLLFVLCKNPTIQNTFTRSNGTTSKNDKPFIVIALYESHGSTFPAYCHVNACIQP